MTSSMGNPIRHRGERMAAAFVLLALATLACGGGNGSSGADASVAATQPLCADDRHVVAFDIFGTLTRSDEDLGDWLGDAGSPPDVRAGAAELVSAYRTRGFEVLYVTTVPAELEIRGQPMAEALAGWLDANGFPTGDHTHLSLWDGNHTAMQGISDELARLRDEGASVDAAYTDNDDKAFTFKSGVPSDKVFTVGDGAASTGTTPVAGDDVAAHARDVAGMGQICRLA
ncbi:MAG TPA: hypothetical protein VFZ79_12970 [Acidimicrobiales bacterium]